MGVFIFPQAEGLALETQEYVRRVPRFVRGKLWLWITAAVVMILLGGSILLFGINRFTLVLAIQTPVEITLEYGTPEPSPQFSLRLKGSLFWKDGIPVEAPVITANAPDTARVCSYTTDYQANYHGWSASAQRKVHVVDTHSPELTLKPYTGKGIRLGELFPEPGFSAWDEYDGDLTDQVTVLRNGGTVYYTVVDASGNAAFAEREIPILLDVRPAITLEGESILTLPVGVPYEEPGFTAKDCQENDLTQQVQVSGEVDFLHPGEYIITYSVTDAEGQEGVVQRLVLVQGRNRPATEYPSGKVIYLTFDDGPGIFTPGLLDVLEKYNAKATFFVVDTGCDDIMRQITEKGHSIGIHSITHNYEEIYSSPEAFFRDLYGMQERILRITGKETWLMRFPGGSSNMVSKRFSPGIMTALTQAVEAAGFTYFDWNVDSEDAGGATKSRQVYENVIEGAAAQPWSVVLQHDIHPYSVEAVESILKWGQENGYTFLPLEQHSPTAHHGVNN